MKKVLSLLAAVAVMAATSAMAATIAGTLHDLSSVTGTSGFKSGTTSQICVFCHTPHNSIQTRALWNRNSVSASSFHVYTSGANAEQSSWFVGGSKTLADGSPSLLCLSCHDGVTTMNNIKRPPVHQAAPNNTMAIGVGTWSWANLGTNLTNDHPISIVYSAAVAGALDAVDNSATLNAADSNGKVDGKLPLANGSSLECNTCHNVHNDTFRPFLRMSNDGSALCRACHIK